MLRQEGANHCHVAAQPWDERFSLCAAGALHGWAMIGTFEVNAPPPLWQILVALKRTDEQPRVLTIPHSHAELAQQLLHDLRRHF